MPFTMSEIEDIEGVIAAEKQMLQDAIGNIEVIASAVLTDCDDNLLKIEELPGMMKAIQDRIRLIRKLTLKAK